MATTSATDFNVICPLCGTVYHTNERHIGNYIQCVTPNCGGRVPIRRRNAAALECSPAAGSAGTSQPSTPKETRPESAGVTRPIPFPWKVISVMAACCVLAVGAFWIYHSQSSTLPPDTDQFAQTAPVAPAPVAQEKAPDPTKFPANFTEEAKAPADDQFPAQYSQKVKAVDPSKFPSNFTEEVLAPSAGASKRAAPSEKTDAKPPQRSRLAREDVGADIAVSVRGQIPLMDRPNADALRILTINERDTLALLSRDATNGWLNVVHVRSGKEGWVKRDDVDITLTKHPSPPPAFSEENVGTDADPEVKCSTKRTAS